MFGVFLFSFGVYSQEGLIPAFEIKPNDLTLHRLAKPGIPFDKVGRKFAILGDESGLFEAWAYPLKLFRNFEFSFLVGTSTRPIKSRDIVRTISVSPEATILTYTYQSFTMKAIFVTSVNKAGAVILIEVISQEPLTIICGFLPVLEPMWPAGLGGQYAYWNDDVKAYVISESSGKNHCLVGSPAASGISYTPAHMLSDTPNEFNIVISDPKAVIDKFIPIYITGGPGRWKEILRAYEEIQTHPEKIYQENSAHFTHLRENTLQISTPEPSLDLAFEWAKVSYDNLIVDNPNLGESLVAGLGASGTSGRPGFGWFFGGDAFINTFSLNSYGKHETVRDILAFHQKWQRKDGKMAHELSQAEGYVDWWNDYPFGYIHADTTPYFIVAMHEYFQVTGDIDFVRNSWKALKKAYQWCLTTDENGDGLMDNVKAGLGALEYGDLTGIQTDIYLAAIWVKASWAMNRLADAAGYSSFASQAKNQFKQAEAAFKNMFWDEGEGFYVYAFNSDGQHVTEISPWCAVGLMWDLGDREPSRRSLERICSSDLMTDWGIRSISTGSEYFSPLNYNYGAVWPFITSWVTTALFKHHLSHQAYSLLMSTAQHTFINSLGNLPEVLSGSQYIWPHESVSHQGFSTAGVVLPTVRGLFGLAGDAIKKEVSFVPHFPAEWKQVKAENYRVGEASFSFLYTKEQDKLFISVETEKGKGYAIRIAPSFGIGTKIKSISANGQAVEFEIKETNQTIRPEFVITSQNKPIKVEIHYDPFVEILPLVPKPQVGDINKGLKIISIQKRGDTLLLHVEGLTGKTYQVGILNKDLVETIKGASLKDDKLFIKIPGEMKGSFVPHKIQIYTRAPLK